MNFNVRCQCIGLTIHLSNCSLPKTDTSLHEWGQAVIPDDACCQFGDFET
jgi:hypothetical protein